MIDYPGEEWPKREGSDFWRNQKGSPMVARLRKRQGVKADLLNVAAAEGVDVPEKVTVAELHELLGPEPGARLEYDRPSHWPFDDWTGVDIKYADRGTLAHDLTEWLDRGGSPDDIPEAMFERAADLDVGRELLTFIANDWLRFRREHGLIPTFIEVTVVNDALMVAGTADEYSTTTIPIVTPFGTVDPDDLVVLDKKTSDECARPGYVVQLARYANSVPYDTETDRRGEWPQPVNKAIGFLAQFCMSAALDGDTSIRWELIPADIATGHTIAEEVHRLKNVDVSAAFGEQIAAPSLPLGVEQPATGDVARQMPSPVATPPLVEFFDNINANPIGGSVDVEEITATIRAHRDGPVATLDEARARYRELSDGDKAAVARYWEANDTDLTDADQIIESIGAVQGFHDVAAEPPPPTPAPTPRAALPTVTDEGDTLDEDTIEAAKKRYGALDDAARAWVAHSAAKVRLSPEHGGKATQRRMEIYRGLCELAESDGFDTDDVVKGICAHILGDIVWQGPKVADILGALSLDEASRFARMCDVVTTGDVAVNWTDDRRMVFSASLVEVAA